MRARKAEQRGNRVFGYIRVSTAREDMISPELQLRHIEEVVARQRLSLVGVVEDLDLSGRDFAKRKVAWMIGEIRAGRADGVVVWKISRWGRNLLDSLLNLRDLQEAKGFLESATEPVGEIDSPMGRFSIAQMMLIAQLQSDQIRESWQDTQNRRRERGLPGDGKPRFGYCYVRQPGEEPHYVIDEQASPWLQRGYEQFVAGRPLSAIVREMQHQGVVGTGGKVLTYSAFMFILDSGFGAGKIILNARRGRANVGEPIYVDGTQPAVISNALWEEYLRLRIERAEKTRRYRANVPASRFTGLIRCGSCGRTMYSMRDGSAPAWACRNTALNSYKPCPKGASIRHHKIEAYVLDWLVNRAQNEAGLYASSERKRRAAKPHVDVQAIERKIRKLETSITRLRHMRAAGEISAEELRADRQDFEGQIRGLRSQLPPSESDVDSPVIETAALDQMQSLWMSSSTEEEELLNRGLRTLLREIRVWPRGLEPSGSTDRMMLWPRFAQSPPWADFA